MEVDISMNVEGVLMEFLRSDEKCAKHCWKLVVQASMRRLSQDGFRPHRVDKPRYCDKEEEFNRRLKFGFVAACILTVLQLTSYEWLFKSKSPSCEDSSGFLGECPPGKYKFNKLWEYLNDSIGPNRIATLAILGALLTVGGLTRINVSRGGILTWLRRRQPLTIPVNVHHV